jgi:hypothetical protein
MSSPGQGLWWKTVSEQLRGAAASWRRTHAVFAGIFSGFLLFVTILVISLDKGFENADPWLFFGCAIPRTIRANSLSIAPSAR